jgi:hypothetical protein
MDRMIRAAAIAVGVLVGASALPASAAIDSYLKVATPDGKPGVVTQKLVNGKTVYILTLNGKPAVPGNYALANGQHVKVIGPDGVVDNASFSWGSKIMLNPQPLPP